MGKGLGGGGNGKFKGKLLFEGSFIGSYFYRGVVWFMGLGGMCLGVWRGIIWLLWGLV